MYKSTLLSKMERFNSKYRISSARLQGWNYGWNGAHFITLCTANLEHFIGEIVEGKMVLSSIGGFANSCWVELPDHFPFVALGEFTVMSNHVHGIIVINKPTQYSI